MAEITITIEVLDKLEKLVRRMEIAARRMERASLRDMFVGTLNRQPNSASDETETAVSTETGGEA